MKNTSLNISIENVTKKYDEFYALKDISLGIQAIAPHPMKSVKRQVGLRDVEVSFGGVSFIPGQYVYADDNGVIVSEAELKN